MVKIGSYGEQSDRMIRAATAGAELHQRAADSLSEQQSRTAAMAGQSAQNISNILTQGRESQQRDEQLAFQKKAEEDRIRMQQQEIDLQAARSGFERQPQGGGELGDRMARLREQMNQGGMSADPEAMLQSEQTSKPLEMSGSKFVPTEQGMAETSRKAFSADTERIRAEAYRDQVRSSLIKAQMSGDKEGVASLKKNLQAPIESDAKMLENFVNGKATDKDWENISSMMKDNPDPELQKEISSGVAGPRVRAVLNQKIASSALKFIETTGGDLPSSGVVDYTNPHMVKFTNEVRDIGALISQLSAQSGGQFSQFLGLKSLDDKIRFQNQLAARSVLNGFTSFNPGAGGSPTAGLPPSAGGPPPTGGGSNLEPVLDQRPAPAGPPPVMAESPQAPPRQAPTYTQMRRSGL